MTSGFSILFPRYRIQTSIRLVVGHVCSTLPWYIWRRISTFRCKVELPWNNRVYALVSLRRTDEENDDTYSVGKISCFRVFPNPDSTRCYWKTRQKYEEIIACHGKVFCWDIYGNFLRIFGTGNLNKSYTFITHFNRTTEHYGQLNEYFVYLCPSMRILKEVLKIPHYYNIFWGLYTRYTGSRYNLVCHVTGCQIFSLLVILLLLAMVVIEINPALTELVYLVPVGTD
jgi:hypothetical protein